MKRLISQLFTAAATLLFVASAAHASGYKRDAPAGQMHVQRVLIPANVTETITVKDLDNSWVNPVLHIQTDHLTTGGDFIAGNDDCTETVLWSCATIPRQSTARWVTVIVRSYDGGGGGTGTLRSSNNLFPPTRITFLTYATELGEDSAPASHLSTVRQNRGFANPDGYEGATDTRMLVVSELDRSRAIAFDDDDGVGKMSWIHTVTPCQRCQVIVGSATTWGMTTLVWDSEAHGTDTDGDALSDNFESMTWRMEDGAMHTNPFKKDADGDGIVDGAEIYGVDVEPSVLEFPFYGAKPGRKDLFLELDWQPGRKLSGAEAKNAAKAFLFNPQSPSTELDVAIHADIGTDAPVADRETYGNFGGATEVPVGGDACAGFTPGRIGFFRHGIMYAANGVTYSDCFFANNNGLTVAHETGHTLKLGHGGFPVSQLNGNVLYHSIMNYSYSDLLAFSNYQLGGVTLNPTSMNETNWAAGLPANINLDYLKEITNVRGREVDWNRDNIFSSTPVRGAVNMGMETAKFFSSLIASSKDESDAALTWLPGAGFYMFTRAGTNLSYRRSVDIETECTKFRANPWEACSKFSTAFTVPNAKVSNAPTATWFTKGTAKAVAAAYRDTGGKLVVSVGSIPARSFTGNLDWAGLSVPGDSAVEGSPSIVRSPDSASDFFVFAGQSVSTGTVLSVWKFTGQTGKLTGPSRCVTSSVNATPIFLGPAGITATLGFVRPSTKAEIFLAVGLPKDTTVDVHPLMFARFTPLGQRVGRLTLLDTDKVGKFYSSRKVGFAYVPFAGGAANDGRFYLAIIPDKMDKPQYTSSIGNDSAAMVDTTTGLKPRVLGWNTRRYYYLSEYDHAVSGMSLSFEPGQDTNLRGAFVGTGVGVLIQPIADGSGNTNFTDHDDWRYIRGNLACTLRNSMVPCAP